MEVEIRASDGVGPDGKPLPPKCDRCKRRMEWGEKVFTGNFAITLWCEPCYLEAKAEP